MVHRRSLGDEELVFGNQGALWGNAMTWWDHDTGSIWSQPLGEAIAGPRKGATLELLPSTLTSWRSWRSDHPDTLALDAPDRRDGFNLDDMAIVVDFGEDTAAYLIVDLRQEVANDVVAGAPIAVVVSPQQPDRWTVLSRRLDDTIVELRFVDGILKDAASSSTWDEVSGRAIAGPLQGEILDRLPGFTSFPDDYLTFWPDGRFWEPSES